MPLCAPPWGRLHNKTGNNMPLANRNQASAPEFRQQYQIVSHALIDCSPGIIPDPDGIIQ
jgi:hypothetical protein